MICRTFIGILHGASVIIKKVLYLKINRKCIRSAGLVIITLVASILTLTDCCAQQFIGISGGHSKGTLLDFEKKQDYEAKYQLKNGVAFSTFYETKVDSVSNFRIELQYQLQDANMEIKNNAGHASFYKKLNYSFQLLRWVLKIAFLIFKNKKS